MNLPENNEAERAVLSQLLKDKHTSIIFDRLKETDFFDPQNRAVFIACRKVWEIGTNIDIITVPEHTDVPVMYIIELNDDFNPNTEDYIDILHKVTTKRELITLTSKAHTESWEGEPEDVIEMMELGINDIIQDKNESVEIEDILNEDIWVDTEKVYTGYKKLDDTTRGFGCGDLIIIAGRPGIGKTTLALNIAVNSGVPTCVFSMEMKRQQIAQNLVGMLAFLPKDGIKTKVGKLLASVGEERLLKKQIMIDDYTGANVFTIKARAMAMKNRGVKMIIIDYLQLISSKMSDTRTRENEMSAISRSLKLLAMQLDIPIIALAQLNRAVEHRKGHRPVLADLRESGAIEQDADKVILLSSKGQGRFVKLVADCAKNRNGPTGSIELTYWRSCYKFF